MAERGDAVVDVESAYRLWSATYDSDDNRTRDLDATILRSHGPTAETRDVLELGCGTGKNTVWLAQACRSFVGFDLSEPMLARARDRVTSDLVRFVRHDVRRSWPLAASSIDLVVGNLVLEHVADLRFVFAEAARVLRPGGAMFVSELHPFRQLLGRGARVPGLAGRRVEAYVHDVGDYVNAALAAGFALRRMGEWRDDGDPDAMPRLLTLELAR